MSPKDWKRKKNHTRVCRKKSVKNSNVKKNTLMQEAAKRREIIIWRSALHVKLLEIEPLVPANFLTFSTFFHWILPAVCTLSENIEFSRKFSSSPLCSQFFGEVLVASCVTKGDFVRGKNSDAHERESDETWLQTKDFPLHFISAFFFGRLLKNPIESRDTFSLSSFFFEPNQCWNIKVFHTVPKKQKNQTISSFALKPTCEVCVGRVSSHANHSRSILDIVLSGAVGTLSLVVSAMGKLRKIVWKNFSSSLLLMPNEQEGANVLLLILFSLIFSVCQRAIKHRNIFVFLFHLPLLLPPCCAFTSSSLSFSSPSCALLDIVVGWKRRFGDCFVIVVLVVVLFSLLPEFFLLLFGVVCCAFYIFTLSTQRRRPYRIFFKKNLRFLPPVVYGIEA